MSGYRHGLIGCCLCIAFSFVPVSGASEHSHEHEQHEGLSGPEFSDPSVMVEMPEAWKSRPLKRTDWAKGADIALSLDQHLYEALLPIIQQYGRDHKLDIAVEEGTCGIAAGRLKDKEADIGGFCCPTDKNDRLPGLSYHTLAIAPVALIVNPKNPVNGVDMETARNIFMGRIALWSQLEPDYPAGAKKPVIRPIGRLHCKTKPGHWRQLLDNENLFSPRLTEVNEIQDMIAAVAENRDAIGHEVIWMTENYNELGRVKTLKLDGMDPRDNSAVVAGRYPLYRVFNISTWSSPTTRSEEADALVAHLMKSMPKVESRYGLIPFNQLRRAGWQFKDDELIGAPK